MFKLWAKKRQFDNSNIQTISKLIELIEQNKKKPKKILISESVYDDICNIIGKDKKNRHILFGIPVSYFREINIFYK